MIPEILNKLVSKRKAGSHKGDFGHVFVIAGSKGLTGAAFLTSQAALRSGSGLVTLGIPESLNEIMERKLTEVMTLPLPETDEQTLSEAAEEKILDFVNQKSDVVALGPGLSQNIQTKKLIQNLVRKIGKPIVLDADGLNVIAGKLEILTTRESETVVTPHPGEMSRLIDKDSSYIQNHRTEVAKTFSAKHRCTTVLKGNQTVVAGPDGKIYINDTGSSALSTAGTGDVLTGMVASFIGQGLNAYQAAVVSVYLHGQAGDRAEAYLGKLSVTATDVLEKIPVVLNQKIK